jgi:hypothetical protein
LYQLNILDENWKQITCICIKLPETSACGPAVENQKIKCNEPMGYTPISLERGMTGLSE